jgi:hypothetical protein
MFHGIRLAEAVGRALVAGRREASRNDSDYIPIQAAEQAVKDLDIVRKSSESDKGGAEAGTKGGCRRPVQIWNFSPGGGGT